jgi:hypothetical protein
MPVLPDQADILAENEQLRARVCQLEGRHHDPASVNAPFGSAEWEQRNPKTGAMPGGPVASAPAAAPAAKSGQTLTDLCRASAKTSATVPQPQAAPPAGQALSLTEQCLAARR